MYPYVTCSYMWLVSTPPNTTTKGGLSRAARLEVQSSRFVTHAASSEVLADPTSLLRVSTNTYKGLPGRRLPWVDTHKTRWCAGSSTCFWQCPASPSLLQVTWYLREVNKGQYVRYGPACWHLARPVTCGCTSRRATSAVRHLSPNTLFRTVSIVAQKNLKVLVCIFMWLVV